MQTSNSPRNRAQCHHSSDSVAHFSCTFRMTNFTPDDEFTMSQCVCQACDFGWFNKKNKNNYSQLLTDSKKWTQLRHCIEFADRVLRARDVNLASLATSLFKVKRQVGLNDKNRTFEYERPSLPVARGGGFLVCCSVPTSWSRLFLSATNSSTGPRIMTSWFTPEEGGIKTTLQTFDQSNHSVSVYVSHQEKLLVLRPRPLWTFARHVYQWRQIRRASFKHS